MPAQPACFHRLDEIFTALRAMTSTRLDRLAVERLLKGTRAPTHHSVAGTISRILSETSEPSTGAWVCQGRSKGRPSRGENLFWKAPARGSDLGLR